MKYDKIVEAIFIERPNRFIARVKIDGAEEVELVHVKNTGRCRELLLPGAEVILEDCIEKNQNRKTRYDLIAVKKNGMWVNIDSQAPNKVVKEWLIKQGYDCIKPEYAFGNSRMDFYMEKGKQKYLMEVKGCTLEIDGVGYFPDAPTERGVKHLRELAVACGQGYKCLIAFVIQMEEISEVRPNTAMQPEFGIALEEAKDAGVEVLSLKCHVGMDRLYDDTSLERLQQILLFKVFDTTKIDEYFKRAKEQWGQTSEYKEFEEKTKNWTKDDEATVANEFMQLFVEFGQMKEMDPEDEQVQLQVRKLQDYITDHFYTCSDKILCGLGRMYAGGGELTENIDDVGGVGTAEFASKAIDIFYMSRR